MARQPLDPPSEFARLVSSAIRREMGDRRMSGRELARRLDKSEGYVRERLKDTFEFTLGDVEAFAAIIGMQPEDFIAAIERRVAPVTPLRRRNVGGLEEDLAEVAYETEHDYSEDTDDKYIP